MRARVFALALGAATVFAGPAGRAAGPAPGLGASIARAASMRRPVSLALPGAGIVTLRLHEVALLEPDVRFTFSDASGRLREAHPPRITTIRGGVDHDPSSIVALTLAGDEIDGTISTRDGDWSVEDGHVTPADAGTPSPLGFERAASLPRPAGLPQAGAGVANCQAFSCNRLRAVMVLDGDVYFLRQDRAHPSRCLTRQVATFNAVAAIYASDPLRIDLAVSHVNCHQSPDLGSTRTDMEHLLASVQTFWNNHADVDRSAVQLSAGYDFGVQGPLGLSFVPGVCPRIVLAGLESARPQSCADGYSVVQAADRLHTAFKATEFLKAKIDAHELGHNFDAVHDPAKMCPPRWPRSGPIMCGSLQESGHNVFSPQSAKAIRSWAEQNLGSVTGT